MKLPIYNLEIMDAEDGIFAVAIVQHPATEQAYMLFSEDKAPMQLRIENEEKRIITGVILTADTPIYRNSEQMGEHYVQFSKDMIRSAMQKFFKEGHHLSANFEHDSAQRIDGVYFYESFQVDADRGVSAPKGIHVNDGSWVGTMRVEDEEVWAKIKDGQFTGFSIEGLFQYTVPEQKDEEEVDEDQELLEIIDELLQKIGH